MADFDLGVKLTRGFHLNAHGDGSAIGRLSGVCFTGSRPGREARIPRAVLAGEGGLLVGYGGCGCPGQGLGCAEGLSGVPRLYEDSRVLEDVKTFIVFQKRKPNTLGKTVSLRLKPNTYLSRTKSW